VSRKVQAGLSLLTGVVVYSTPFGGLFALVFAVADRRVVNLRRQGRSRILDPDGARQTAASHFEYQDVRSCLRSISD
jgi:hypothetical protein